ncbi:hypothetical protein [Hominenteromicrobium sp.]
MFQDRCSKTARNALEFTRVYKENANDIYLREAACMDFQLKSSS